MGDHQTGSILTEKHEFVKEFLVGLHGFPKKHAAQP